MKTNILFIANIFPPMGGSGVQRSAKFVKYLPELNIQPFVLTREYNRGIKDTTLLDEIPKDVVVTRTKAYDYTQWSGPMNLVGKVIARKLLIPDGEVTWYKKSIDTAVEMIKKHKIQGIYSTSYPYSDHLLGYELKKRFPNLPWIVDFRDEWSMNPYIIDKGYSQYRTQKEKKLEEMIAKECDFFIANTPIMHENFLQMYPFLAEKSIVITNGFDEDDFNHVDRTYIKKDKFVIVHPGVIYGNRKIDKVLRALQELEQAGKIDKNNVRLRLIGHIKLEDIQKVAQAFDGKEYIECPGYLDHKETIKELVNAEVLLLLLREGEGGKNIAPGKIYEYINANRKILALAPKDGVAAQIIRETQTGIICDTTNVDEIKEGILTMYNAWLEQEFDFEPNQEAVLQYGRLELTKKLATIIQQLI